MAGGIGFSDWLDLKLDGPEDGVINMTVRDLLLEVDYYPSPHAPLALHRFRPGNDGLLLIRVEDVSNDNLRLTALVGCPCGID